MKFNNGGWGQHSWGIKLTNMVNWDARMNQNNLHSGFGFCQHEQRCIKEDASEARSINRKMISIRFENIVICLVSNIRIPLNK